MEERDEEEGRGTMNMDLLEVEVRKKNEPNVRI